MKLFRFFLLFLLPLFSNAQPYGNEWIDYNQQYLKIPVTSNGIYKLDYPVLNTEMASIGVSLASIDPRNIQMFAHGKEVPIDLLGENDGRFDASDYILFHGEKNDGWYDAGLYKEPTEPRLNPYYSLFSDTSYYFLTWNNQINNNRYKPSSNTNFSSKVNQPYFFSQNIDAFSSQYSVGEKDNAGVASPFYYQGEGWSSPTISVPLDSLIYPQKTLSKVLAVRIVPLQRHLQGFLMQMELSIIG
jgi:hypothetical protein